MRKQCILLCLIIPVFYEMFLSSGVAAQMETGNPRYVSGLSGMELMRIVLTRASDIIIPETTYSPLNRTPVYWAGWVLSYYQWTKDYSFLFIQRNGLDINTVLALYPTLHEADLSKFVESADAILKRLLSGHRNTLKAIRKQQKFTQKQLAELSGVSLRMIQAYEQGDQDIRKAEAQTVFALSRVLGCTPETLCQ